MVDEFSDEINVKQRVGTGCVLHYLVFDIYSQVIFEGTIHYEHIGIEVNGKSINDLRLSFWPTL